MGQPYKNILLGGTALLLCVALGPSGAYANCNEGGANIADCNFNADTDPGMTIGNVGAGVTATVDTDIAIDDAVDDDDGTPDGNIVTNGTGVTVTQSAAVGGVNALNTITIGDGDQWTSTANVATAGALTVGGGTSGSFIISGAGATVDVNNATGSVEIAAGGTLEVQNSTFAVNLGNAGGIDIADGGVLLITDGANLTLGAVDGDTAGVGTLRIAGDYDTNSVIGGGAALAAVQVTGGNVVFDQAITATTIGFTVGGANLTINAGANLSVGLTGSAGNDTLVINGGTFGGDFALGSGDDDVTINLATLAEAIDGQGGATDTLTFAQNFDMSNTIANFERIELGGFDLTVDQAITGLDNLAGSGINADGGTIRWNAGGSIGGAVTDTGAGTGTFIIGGDMSGGIFNLQGIVQDVNIQLDSGTLDTNGNNLGTGGAALSDIMVAVGSRFNVNNTVTSDGDLTNAGTIFIGVNDVLTVDSMTDAAGTFIIEVGFDPEGPDDEFGSVVVSTGAVDLTSATIEIQVSDVSGVLTDGNQDTIFSGGAPVVGGPGVGGQAVDDNSFLYDFTISTPGGSPNDVVLTTTRQSLASATTSANNLSVANTLLDTLSTNLDGDIRRGQASLVGATNQQQFNDRLASLLPPVDGAVREAGLTAMQETVHLTSERLAGLRQNRNVTGMASGGVTEGVKVWFQPFLQTATQDPREGINGYDSVTYGFAGGFDNSSIFEDVVLGLALSYANSDIDSENESNTESEVDSYMLSIYGDYDIDRRTYLSGQLAYTHNDIRTIRSGLAGLSNAETNTDYGSDQFGMFWELGRDYEAGAFTTLTPTLSLGYTHYVSDDYTEKGSAGGLGLAVDTSTSDILDLGAGLEASWIYRKRNGAYLKPSIYTKLTYDVIGDEVITRNRFIGSGRNQFTVNGSDPAQFGLNFGVSNVYFGTDNWEISSRYDLHYKEDYLSHTGSLKFAYKF